MRTLALAFPLTGYSFVQCAVYDALWVLVTQSPNERKAAFIALYALEVTEVELEGFDLPVCVLTTDNVTFWAGVIGYVLSPSGACLGGCGYSVIP